MAGENANDKKESGESLNEELKAQAQRYLEEGEKKFRQNNLEEAVTILKNATGLDPGSISAHLLLGMCYEMKKDYQNLAETHEKLYKIFLDLDAPVDVPTQYRVMHGMLCGCGGALKWQKQMLKKADEKFYDHHLLKCQKCGKERELKFRTELKLF